MSVATPRFALCLGAFSMCLLLGGQASQSAVIRQTAINPANGHTYHLLRGDGLGSGVTPLEAEAFAQSHGGHLVTLNDFQENAWVLGTFQEFYLYIGLNDVDQEGVFEWYSGEPVTYTNWYPGEPKNFGGTEDWVHVYNFSNGNFQWNDVSNVSELSGFPAYAVMEIVPEPSSVALLAVASLLALTWLLFRRRGFGKPALALVTCAAAALGIASPANSTTVVFTQNAPLPIEAGGNGVALYTGTRDAHLREHGGMGTNQGEEPFLVIGQYADDEGDDTRILLDFDYGSFRNHDFHIVSATLRLYLRDATGNSISTGQVLDVFAAKSRFNEGTGAGNGRDGRPALPGESTWSHNAFPLGAWSGGGSHGPADWLPTPLDVGTVLNGQSATGYYDFDVTDAFAPDGSTLTESHAGFVILARVDNENPLQDGTFGGKQFLFDSSEFVGGNAPQLVFEVETVPEPSTLLLLTVGLTGLIALGSRPLNR